MLGIVVIGRNEGERLKRCLKSVGALGFPVVYVDSASTDGSIELARSMGADVVELDMSVGFTAARARNEGAERCRQLLGIDLEFIHFFDGDCEVVPGWIEAAKAALVADASLAAVAGRCRERRPDATIYNRYCDMEWNTPVGEARALGGNALYRFSAFTEVGGFDPQFICGEEPELCYRLRQKDWRVQRLDHDMVLHDAAMTRWAHFWKRMVRSGWAYGEGAATYGDGPERYNVRERQRIVLWGGALPMVSGGLLIAGAGLSVAGFDTGVWLFSAGIVMAGLLILLALKTAYGRRKSHGDPWKNCMLYGGLVTAAKIPQYTGIRQYELKRSRGEVATIIEYKNMPEKSR